MIRKCKDIKQFEFTNDEFIIRLHKGNPVYGNRLCIYKRLNPVDNELIFDETENGHNTNGWIKGKYNKVLNDKVVKVIEALY